MEGVEAALLAHVCGPRFAAMEEGAQYTGLLHSHLGVLSEHRIYKEGPRCRTIVHNCTLHVLMKGDHHAA